jgi:hypothetical protein
MVQWVDTSGQDHTITTHNSPTESTDTPSGFSGYSTDLNGSNQYLSIADHSDFDFGSSTDFTLDCWVKFDVLQICGFIQKFNYDNSPAAYYGYQFDIHTGVNLFRLSLGSGSSYKTLTSSWTASTATWYHLAFVREGTDISLYKDGSRMNTTTGTYNVDTSYDVKIGVLSFDLGTPGNYYLNGKIFLPRITASALFSGTTYTVPTISDYNETGQKLLVEVQAEHKKIYPVNNPLSGNLTNLGVF